MTDRKPPVRLPRAIDSLRAMRWTRLAPAFVAILTAASLVAAGGATAQPGGNGIDSKRAEARQVMAQMDAINNELEARMQAYDDAVYRLGKVKAQLKLTKHQLRSARVNLKVAQVRLQQRAVAVYTSTQDESAVSVLLGATSLEDLMNRLDAAKRVSQQDASVVRQVTEFRDAVQHHQSALVKARAEQAKQVVRRAAEKGTVERKLAERQAYLNNLNSEIKQAIAAQEAARRAAAARAAAQAQAQLAARAQAASNVASAVSSPVSSDAQVQSDGVTGGPPPSGHGDQVASLALAEQGKPYVWAAAGPDGFDCSGLVVYVYAQIGISLPHSSYALAGMGAPVDRADLQPGDLVFFNGNGHMGIYIGGGNMVHAPHTGDVVRVASIDAHGGYGGARRI